MSWVDIVIIGTVCLCGAYGLWKGIIKAVIAIAGLLAALLLAGAYYHALAATLWPAGGSWTPIAAYAIILLCVLIAAALVAATVSHLAHMTPLGIIDRLLGLVAGLLVAALGWGLLFTLVAAIIPGADTALAEYPLADWLMGSFAAVRGLSLSGAGAG